MFSCSFLFLFILCCMFELHYNFLIQIILTHCTPHLSSKWAFLVFPVYSCHVIRDALTPYPVWFSNWLNYTYCLKLHWNNRPQVNIVLYSDIIQSSSNNCSFSLMQFALQRSNTYQLIFSLWPDRGSNSRCTTFEANTITITAPMRF